MQLGSTNDGAIPPTHTGGEERGDVTRRYQISNEQEHAQLHTHMYMYIIII